MRTATLLMAICAISSSGCSAYVLSSGSNLSKFKNRDDVQASFGQPADVRLEDGALVEEYVTRRKIAEFNVEGILMVDTVTLGLSEFYFLPYAAYLATRRSLVGQHVVFKYDGEGRVTEILWDGDFQFLPPREEPATKE